MMDINISYAYRGENGMDNIPSLFEKLNVDIRISV